MVENAEYTKSLQNKHEQIIKNVQELQAVETYMFDQIQKSNSEINSNLEKKNLNNFVNTLKNTRSNLLTSLKKLYDGTNETLDNNTKHLTNQAIMTNQMDKELMLSNQKYKSLLAEKNNKQRLAQIGEYEYAKNYEHKAILKTIVYGSFFILIVIFLNSNNVLPTFLTKIIVVIITFVVILLTIQRFYWNYKRDNINYSKFQFKKKEKEQEDAKYKNDLTLSKLFGLECKNSLEEFQLLNKDSCKIL